MFSEKTCLKVGAFAGKASSTATSITFATGSRDKHTHLQNNVRRRNALGKTQHKWNVGQEWLQAKDILTTLGTPLGCSRPLHSLCEEPPIL